MTRSFALSNKWAAKLIPWGFVAFTCIALLHLGRDPLFDWDEAIYGQLGKELLSSGKLFTNSWNMELWFEKPPGISWLSGLGQALFPNEFGARFFMPILSGLTLFLTYLLGRKLFKSWQVGAIASGILGSLTLFLDRTRALNTDLPLVLGVVASSAALLYNLPPLVFALTIAFAVWFKGLAGLLALAISLPILIKKEKSYLLYTIFYFLAFTIPWHLYAYLRFGETFYRPYLLEQVLTRATVPIEFHLESRWYYFNFLVENLDWGVVLVTILGGFLLARYALKSKILALFLPLWWLLFPLFAFTLARTRLYWYIFPTYPAIALLSSYAVSYFARGKTSQRILTILAVGTILHACWSVYQYTDPTRTTPTSYDRLEVVKQLGESFSVPLAFLVPPTERVAEAILPIKQRISSSFRYGGAPSVTYYYQAPVSYFYNTDRFQEYLATHPDSPVIVSRDDSQFVLDRHLIIATDKYLGFGGLDE